MANRKRIQRRAIAPALNIAGAVSLVSLTQAVGRAELGRPLGAGT